MFLHENEKCPVCDRIFTPDDDIVICPVCGTPHHRECYDSLKHCFNADKHKDGFVYENKSAEEKSDTSPNRYNPNNEYYTPDESHGAAAEKGVCSQCGARLDADAQFCINCGARQKRSVNSENTQSQEQPFFSPQVNEYTDSTQKIEGRKLSDIAAVIKTNTERFIRKFKANKIVSWNWGGFFFGPYYLFFRKMYKPAILLMAVSLTVSLVVNGAFVEQIDAFNSVMTSMMNTIAQSSDTAQLSNELMAQATAVYKEILPMLLIMGGANLLISLFTAMFSDKLYRSKVLQIVDKAEEKLDGDNDKGMIMVQADPRLSQNQIKQLYLSSLGGTNLFAPLMAYMALQLVLSFISRL